MANRNNKKQKTLFVIPLPRRHKIKVTKILVEWLILILLISLTLISGILPLAYRTLTCGQTPFEAPKFEENLRYLPNGVKGYGNHSDKEYYCTYEEMRAAFLKFQSSDANRKIVRENVDFLIYLPEGYEKTPIIISQDLTQVLYQIIVDKIQVSVSERKEERDAYFSNVCNRVKSPSWSCELIGKDKKGREIYKVDSEKYKVNSFVLYIGETQITLQNRNSLDFDKWAQEMTNRDAIEIFNSMKPSTE